MIAILSSPSLPIASHFKASQQPSFLHHKPRYLSLPPKSKFKIYAGTSDSDRQEEIRWAREEQRWLREEQRWLREESRWHSERDSLLREIASLKLQIENLERRYTSLQGASDTVTNIASLLQIVKDKDLGQNIVSRIAESGSGPSPIVLEPNESEIKEEEVAVKEIRVVEEARKTFKKTTLKKGAEGEDVRVMQEALQKLGFYSGEEDTEFSSFASGTDRAVKTWQASVGVPEDGVMTAELLELLYEQPVKGVTENSKRTNEVTNGAAVISALKSLENQKKVQKQKDIPKAEVPEHRVFLLGENRWEEPSRLLARRNQTGGNESRGTTTKCTACRGEGRLLCMECDGTGEPNVEEQFLEWVDGDAKCPYCEGLGHTICDVCQGKATV